MQESGRTVNAGRPLSVIEIPDSRLYTKSSPIIEINDEVRGNLDDMVATIADRAVGLAAVQVAIMKRMLIIDCHFFINKDELSRKSAPPNTDILRMVNPEIISSSDELCEFEEGCVSVPGIFLKIKRPQEVTVTYQDYWGNPQELTVAGRLADCLQHEMDHLNGVVITDLVSPLKKKIALKKLEKERKASKL